MTTRDGLMLGVGAVGPWVLAVVLHRLTQRRLPVRTDWLMRT